MTEQTTVMKTLSTFDPHKLTAPGNPDHPDGNVSLAMHLAIELYTDAVVRVLEQHVRDDFVRWLTEFEIEPTEDLQAHYWQWAQNNDYTGRHMLVRVVKRFLDELGVRVVLKD